MDSKQFNITQTHCDNPGFEGVEKNLKVEFLNSSSVDCRRISRKSLDSILTEARCTIIGTKSNRFFDSYVLSESSLFVYPHKMILKTCGTTRLLSCLPTLLECAKEIGALPTRVLFSRCNFIFPHVQPTPHCSFDMEVQHLDKHFAGTPYILGPINGPRWHVYATDHMDRQAKPPMKENVLEIAMFELDRNAMSHYYLSSYSDILDSKDSKVTPNMQKYAGELATRRSGIANILPGFDIDWHLFTPCGYSCNALKDEFYFTIHVTPEPHCSFVSFETNMPADNDLIGKVLSVFRPGRFCVLGTEDGITGSRLPPWFEGFTSIGVTNLTVNASTTVSSAQYIKSAPKDRMVFDQYENSPDSADCVSSDTDADAKGKPDKKKKRKKRCKKKKKSCFV